MNREDVELSPWNLYGEDYEEVKYYTDTMEMMKEIKAYIDNFDK